MNKFISEFDILAGLQKTIHVNKLVAEHRATLEHKYLKYCRIKNQYAYEAPTFLNHTHLHLDDDKLPKGKVRSIKQQFKYDSNKFYKAINWALDCVDAVYTRDTDCEDEDDYWADYDIHITVTKRPGALKPKD